MILQFNGRYFLPIFRDVISDESRVAIDRFGNNRRLFYFRVALQNVFDFTQFNSKAAHLNLIIDTIQEFQIAVRQKTYQIAGSVKS